MSSLLENSAILNQAADQNLLKYTWLSVCAGFCLSQNLIPYSRVWSSAAASLYLIFYQFSLTSLGSGLPSSFSWTTVTLSCLIYLLILQKPYQWARKLFFPLLSSTHKDKRCLFSAIWNIFFLSDKFTIKIGYALNGNSCYHASAIHISCLWPAPLVLFTSHLPCFLYDSPRN